MNILLERPITEKPKKPGLYWLRQKTTMKLWHIDQKTLDNWQNYSWYDSWYQEIELNDNTIIAQ